MNTMETSRADAPLVLILGLGETGVAAARWCARQGARLRVADTRAEPGGLAALREALAQSEVEYRLGCDESFDTALLDAAMGGACWTVLDDQQIFLTADLRVEFLRSSPADAELVATGTVVRATQRVVFCAGELHGPDGVLLATSRCTQVVLPAEHRANRLRRDDAAAMDADAGADGAALD